MVKRSADVGPGHDVPCGIRLAVGNCLTTRLESLTYTSLSLLFFYWTLILTVSFTIQTMDCNGEDDRSPERKKKRKESMIYGSGFCLMAKQLTYMWISWRQRLVVNKRLLVDHK